MADELAQGGKGRVTGSRYVHKDRWIAVRADDCVTEDGVSVAPYYVLEYPDWVEIVALDADDNLLLVRQYRHGIADFSIELPAGGMDPSDADPCTAAARELLEETGCAGDMVWVGDARPNASTHANRAHIVLARNVVRVAAPKNDPTERIEPFWVPAAEALRMALAGELDVGMHVGSLLRGLAHAGVVTMTAGGSAA
jgi:8-oxo-dGTP pyrophosphatase MutT (NUDIX family)